MTTTSFLGNLRNIKDKKVYSIMRYTPKQIEKYLDGVIIELSPSKKLFKDRKENSISDKEYKERYFKELDKISKKKIRLLVKDKTLVCGCNIGEFCHRHLLAEYLEDNLNIDVNEEPFKKQLKVSVIDQYDRDVIKRDKKSLYVYSNISSKQNIIAKLSNTFSITIAKYIRKTKHGLKINYIEDNKSDIFLITKELNRLRRYMYMGKHIVFHKDLLDLGLHNIGMSSPKMHIYIYTYLNKYFLKYK